MQSQCCVLCGTPTDAWECRQSLSISNYNPPALLISMLITIAVELAGWMLANIVQTSSRRRAISTCILNTFARRLLDRVNGVLLTVCFTVLCVSGISSISWSTQAMLCAKASMLPQNKYLKNVESHFKRLTQVTLCRLPKWKNGWKRSANMHAVSGLSYFYIFLILQR